MSVLESEKKTYYHNLDFMKAVGICMVLCLHVPLLQLDYGQGMKFYIQYAIRLIAEGVPVFLTVNGFLLFSKKMPSLSKHYKKTLNLFLIFLGWAVFYTLVGLLAHSEAITFSSVAGYVFATNVGSQYTGVLWFLQNLLAVYLIFPMLKMIYDHNIGVFKILFVILSVFTVGSSTLILIRDGIAAVGDAAFMNGLLAFIDRFSPVGNGWYVFYFCLGGMMYHYREWIEQHRKVLATVGLLAWIIAWAVGLILSHLFVFVYNPAFNYGSLFMPFIICGLYAATLPFQAKGIVGGLISSLGKHTMGVYLTHFLFIWSIDWIMTNAGWFKIYNAPVRMGRYVLVLAGAWVLSVLIYKVPFLRKTVLM